MMSVCRYYNVFNSCFLDFATKSGLWVPEQIPWDVLYLCGVILVARVMVLFGLWKKNYLVS